MDDAVGTIYRAQQALGAGRMANSIIIFSSDNGAPPAGSGPTGIDHTTDAEGRPCTGFMGCPNSAPPTTSTKLSGVAAVRFPFPDPFGLLFVVGGVEWLARNYPYRKQHLLCAPTASLTTRIATGGWKSQIWDGGLHVAGFVHSPLLPKSAQGTQHHGLFHVTDWLPTIVAAAGGDTSINQPLDG